MKITLISNLYEPYSRGGAEIIVKRTARELVAQGHQVSIISARPWSGFDSLGPEAEEVDRINVIRFYPLNLFFYANDFKWPLPFRLIWLFFDLFNFHSSNLIKDILQAEKPDLVITHNLMGLGYFVPGVISRLGIKHIHVLHDIQLAVRSGLMKKGQEKAWFVSGPIARIYQKIVKALFGSPDIVISPSKFLLDFYTKQDYFPESKKEVLANPIDSKFLAYQLKESQEIDKKTVKFGVVGQLAGHKGFLTVKTALEGLTDANIELHIVGDGPLKTQVQEWADQQDQVTYHGRIANEELPDFYYQMDAIIVPTETYENSPTVVYESLATGTPLIVSDIGGAAEAIKENENGMTFEPGNSDQLIEKIKTMIVHHGEMREHCRESVKGMGSGEYVQELMSL